MSASTRVASRDANLLFQPESLAASGLDMILAQAMYAIVGALALEQGGAVANKISKERILAPMGLRDRAKHLESGSRDSRQLAT